MNHIFILFIIFSFIISYKELCAESKFESPESWQAYHSFWENFERRQLNLIKEGQDKYRSDQTSLDKNFETQINRLKPEMIIYLHQAIQSYRTQLQKNKQSNNRPLILLNLAQVFFLLSEQAVDLSIDEKEHYNGQAIKYLEEIRKDYRYFSKWDFSVYLLASIYQSIEKTNLALRSWKILGNRHIHSIYHVYAHTAIGDNYFNSEKPQFAVIQYEKSLSELNKLDSSYKKQEKTMLHFRLAWASYRAGSLQKVLKYTKKILDLELSYESLERQRQIKTDSVLLATDTLFELSEIEEIYSFLDVKKAGDFATEIGAKLIKKFKDSKQNYKLIDTAEFLLQHYPLSLEAPEILFMIANAYKENSQYTNYMNKLEALSLILPKNSLWRRAHRNKTVDIEKMSQLAFLATRAAAEWHYNIGRSSSLKKSYMKAAAYYSTLLEYNKNHKEAMLWRIKKADCYYFSQYYDEASSQYSKLIQLTHLNKPMLERASYQLVLSYEKIWRQNFSLAQSDNINETNIDINKSKLLQVERAVDHYIQEFPNSSKSIDLILVIASAHRDQANYTKSIELWSRLLLMDSSVSQRKIALRGIIFSSLIGREKAKTREDLISFLRLENWSKLGITLKNEFTSILTQVSLDEAKHLSESGFVKKAGELLITVSKNISLPNEKSKLIYTGTTYLATVGLWENVQESCEYFLDLKIKLNKNNILYLLAKSYDYQLRFSLAAKYYNQFAFSYPGHEKAKASLLRAQILAEAENDFSTAANSLKYLSQIEKTTSKKRDYQKKAIFYHLEAKENIKAIKLAKLMLNYQKKIAHKLEAKLMLSKAYLANKENLKSMNIASNIIAQVGRYKKILGIKHWGEILSQASLILAEENTKNFTSIELLGDIQNFKELLELKSNYYNTAKKNFKIAIETKSEPWSEQARYKLADISEIFALSINSSLFKMKSEGLTIDQDDFRKAKSLQSYSQQLFGKNVLLSSQANKAKRNIWIEKSKWRINKFSHSQLEPYNKMNLPHAIHLDIPYQWKM